MRICPRCNSQIPLQNKICNICASSVNSPSYNPNYDNSNNYVTNYDENNILEDKKICPSCQTNNNAKWAFCSSCGGPLFNIIIVEKPKPNIKSNRESTSISTPANESLNSSKEKSPLTKTVANSLQDLIFCVVCGQANNKEAEICISCQNPTSRTLAMGSEVSHPKLRLMKDSGDSEIYDITEDQFLIGRTSGDITFPDDNYMSNLHARIVRRNQKFFLIDEQSKNGIYKRIQNELILTNGNIILIGKQVFRFEQ